MGGALESRAGPALVALRPKTNSPGTPFGFTLSGVHLVRLLAQCEGQSKKISKPVKTPFIRFELLMSLQVHWLKPDSKMLGHRFYPQG
jgi:hypothetical protein